MKKLIIIILLAWSIPAIAQIKSVTLTASGLTCSMCSKAIFKTLEKVPSVKSVDADVEQSSFTVLFKEGAAIAPDDIKNAVENAGFSVASMSVTAGFTNAEVFNDAHLNINGKTYHFLNVPRQVLEGDKTFTIVDKNYLPASAHKKYGRYTKMECFQTGMMASCCDKHSSNRIYHVTL